MPEEVFFNKENGVIEVLSYGDVTLEELMSVLQSIKALVKETNITKILVDTTKEKTLPYILDLDNFANIIPDFLRVAIVAAGEQPTKNRSRYIADLAAIKGAKVDTFDSRDEALAWLHS